MAWLTRWTRKKALNLLTLLAMVATPLALPWFLVGSWVRALAWNYSTIAAFGILLEVIGRLRPDRGKLDFGAFTWDTMNQGVRKTMGSAARARYFAGVTAINLAAFCAWPLWLLIFLCLALVSRKNKERGSGKIRFRAYLALYPPHLLLVATCLLAAFAVSALFTADLLDPATARFAHSWLVLTTIAWSLAVLMEPAGLAGALKQSEGNSYLQFAAIGGSLLGVYCISFTALTRPADWLDLPSLVATAKDLLAFRGVFDMSEEPTWTNLGMIGAGSLLYLIVVRQLASFRDFDRTDDDLYKLAVKWLQAGAPSKVLEYLARVSNVDFRLLYARSTAMLGLGNVQAAVETMQKAADLAEASGKTFNGPHVELVVCAPMFSNSETQLKVIRHWLAADADDVVLFVTLPGIFQVQPVEVIHDALAEHDGENRFPLSWTWTLFVSEKLDEGKAVLEKLGPQSGIVGLAAAALQLVYLDEMERLDEGGPLAESLSDRIAEIESPNQYFQAFLFIYQYYTVATAESSKLAVWLAPVLATLEQKLPRDRFAQLAAEGYRVSIGRSLKRAQREAAKAKMGPPEGDAPGARPDEGTLAEGRTEGP